MFSTYEQSLQTMEVWGHEVAIRDIDPTGFAWEIDGASPDTSTVTSVVRRANSYESPIWPNSSEVEYWYLRDTQYGSSDLLFADCQMLKRHGKKIIATIVHTDIVTEEGARRRLRFEPEQQHLVLAGSGRLALLTEHTHLKGSGLKTVSNEQLPASMVINPEAVRQGYTPDELIADFLTDLEQHRLYGKNGVQGTALKRAAGKLFDRIRR